MTYQVLARKWRPRNFKEMAGQSHVLKTLINSLDNNRLHHAYLFTGTRGVGKTTIARILAKCLNCEVGVSSEPCGQCSACTEIDEGRFVDLIEVDAASRTKVEDTRELLDNVQYMPSRGRFKVFLIDEVHMLSGHSFNALLKTLEEPPAHVKFLLATTDPQKLPITVLSRCLQFSLKNLSPERIMEHLKFILEQEKIDFEEAALWHLGRAAKGSVRDALTLLDQAISFCDGNISEVEVNSFLGNIDQAIIHKLVDALIAEDAKGLLDIINAAADHSPDFTTVLEELMSYLHRVAIAQVVPTGVDNTQGDKANILAHAKAITAENIQLYYQIALKGREELPLSVDARSGIEMTLLRMLAFTPQGVPNKPMTALSSQPENNETDDDNQLKKKSVDKSVESRSVVAESQPESTDVAPVEEVSTIFEPAIVQKQESPIVNELQEPSIVDMPEIDLESEEADVKVEPEVEKTQQTKTNTQVITELPAPEASPNVPPISEESIVESVVAPIADPKVDSIDKVEIAFTDLKPELWISLFYGLNLGGIVRNIASNCILISAVDNTVELLLAESQSAVYNEEHKNRIQTAFSEYFSQSLIVNIEVGDITGETPAAFRSRKEQERMHIATETFTNDSNVQEIIEKFDGRIQVDSIEPLTAEDY